MVVNGKNLKAYASIFIALIFSPYAMFVVGFLCFQCQNCAIPMYFYQVVTPAILHLPAILISGFFYWRTLKTLKSLISVDRKELITKTLFSLWIFWTITSLPYVIFRATDELQVWRDRSELSEGSFYFVMEYLRLNANGNAYAGYSDSRGGQVDLGKIKRLWFIEVLFRTVKMSYGIINCLLLIVLLKPFNEPIVKALKKLKFITAGQ